MVVKGWVEDEIDPATGKNELYNMTVSVQELQEELNELGNEAFETAEFLGTEKDEERLSTVVRSMWEYLSRVMFMCERYYTRANIPVDWERDKGYKVFRRAITVKECILKELISEIRDSCGDMLEAAADMADETDDGEVFVTVSCVMDYLCWLNYLCGKYWEEYKKEHNG